jgi:hypothetical protein
MSELLVRQSYNRSGELGAAEGHGGLDGGRRGTSCRISSAGPPETNSRVGVARRASHHLVVGAPLLAGAEPWTPRNTARRLTAFSRRRRNPSVWLPRTWGDADAAPPGTVSRRIGPWPCRQTAGPANPTEMPAQDHPYRRGGSPEWRIGRIRWRSFRGRRWRLKLGREGVDWGARGRRVERARFSDGCVAESQSSSFVRGGSYNRFDHTKKITRYIYGTIIHLQ